MGVAKASPLNRSVSTFGTTILIFSTFGFESQEKFLIDLEAKATEVKSGQLETLNVSSFSVIISSCVTALLTLISKFISFEKRLISLLTSVTEIPLIDSVKISIGTGLSVSVSESAPIIVRDFKLTSKLNLVKISE